MQSAIKARLLSMSIACVVINSLFISCQSSSRSQITIVEDESWHSINTDELIPLLILTEAGISVAPQDKILLDGRPIQVDQPVNAGESFTLQVRRAVNIRLITPEGERNLMTAASNVGESLVEAGITLFPGDSLDPPAISSITEGMSISWTPAREVTVFVDDKFIILRATAATVGEALAEAGMPLVGLDYSSPAENEALPEDGQIRIVRVNEDFAFNYKTIPFETEYQDSAEVELGQEQVLQPGQSGLAVTRTRVRYEDGQEVSRNTESEAMLRPPQTRIAARGTQIVLKSTVVDGVTIEYWRAIQMYATVYSPCNSGTGGCSYGTSSGLRAGKGVVAVDKSVYYALQGQRLYVPGYGYAVIGDIGGGSIIENQLGISRHLWIDLGFDDNNLVNMTGWLTVYYLAPAPATIPLFME